MDLEELLSLIKIREYVFNNRGHATFDKNTFSVLSDMLLLLDEKIVALLTSPEFKDYIGYKNVREAKERAAYNTSIYSGLKNRK